MILHVLGKDFCRQYMLESCCGVNESYSELASPETRPPETHHICKPPETLHCACNFQGQLGLLLEVRSLRGSKILKSKSGGENKIVKDSSNFILRYAKLISNFPEIS
jgi:hypothetical protein